MDLPRPSIALTSALALLVCLKAGPASASEEYAPDGLPHFIPAPGSRPPTVDEWNAVRREVTVKKSSKYHCETKMLREWLRVTCYPYDGWTLRGVETTRQQGQRAYTGVFGPKATVVVQVIEGKSYAARFTWGPDNSARDLNVSWPRGARPVLAFD